MKVGAKVFLAALLMSSGVAFSSTNVAALGTATQSSTSYDVGYNGSGPASQAIDGNTNGNYLQGSVTHSGSNGADNWWSLSLPEIYSVSIINLFNRTDCCGDRINGFSVSLFNGNTQTWTSGVVDIFMPSIVGSNISGMTFDLQGAIGDRVLVSKTNADWLHIAEVEVMAAPVPEPESCAMLLVGLGLMLGVVRRRKH